jgi:hypothetical protein
VCFSFSECKIAPYLSADLGCTFTWLPFSTLSSKSSPDTVASNSFSDFMLCTPAIKIAGIWAVYYLLIPLLHLGHPVLVRQICL